MNELVWFLIRIDYLHVLFIMNDHTRSLLFNERFRGGFGKYTHRKWNCLLINCISQLSRQNKLSSHCSRRTTCFRLNEYAWVHDLFFNLPSTMKNDDYDTFQNLMIHYTHWIQISNFHFLHLSHPFWLPLHFPHIVQNKIILKSSSSMFSHSSRW